MEMCQRAGRVLSDRIKGPSLTDVVSVILMPLTFFTASVRLNTEGESGLYCKISVVEVRKIGNRRLIYSYI